jgi:hypothetical protein
MDATGTTIGFVPFKLDPATSIGVPPTGTAPDGWNRRCILSGLPSRQARTPAPLFWGAARAPVDRVTRARFRGNLIRLAWQDFAERAAGTDDYRSAADKLRHFAKATDFDKDEDKPWVLPVAMMAIAGFTHTQAPLPPADRTLRACESFARLDGGIAK